jgi:hypothetical protein
MFYLFTVILTIFAFACDWEDRVLDRSTHSVEVSSCSHVRMMAKLKINVGSSGCHLSHWGDLVYLIVTKFWACEQWGKVNKCTIPSTTVCRQVYDRKIILNMSDFTRFWFVYWTGKLWCMFEKWEWADLNSYKYNCNNNMYCKHYSVFKDLFYKLCTQHYWNVS